MNTPLMFHKLRSGLEAASALVGLASANPTRTPPSPQSLRTSLPTRSNWNNKFPCNTLCLSRNIFPFKIRIFRKKHNSVIELASLSVSSVSYLLGMNTKKAVHRNNHWNSNMKLKKKKLLSDDVLLESTNSVNT